MTKKRSRFDHDGHYEYGFTPSGLFTILNKKGESYYNVVLPLFEKLGSHLIWIFLWIVAILVSNLLFSPHVLRLPNLLMMSLIFVHLMIFGSRLTHLLLQGGCLAVLFPPLWIRITRQFQKGKGTELLEKHKLRDHPGLLVNLGLIQIDSGRLAEGKQRLEEALVSAPGHPIIEQIYTTLSTKDKS